MLFSHPLLLLTQAVAFVAASPTIYERQDDHTFNPSPRPSITFGPKSPRIPHSIGVRDKRKVCRVRNPHDGRDASEFILEAMNKCNDGGTVVFKAGESWTIGTALDLTFLKHIDIDIQGTIKFTNDTDYWQANSFKHGFQNATTFFQLGGEDVNVFGGGTIDGNGQVWYDLYAANIYILRPILFGVIGLKSGSISNLKWRYSPQYYSFVKDSSDVVFDNIDISGGSVSKNPAKNTDGWDTYRSTDITIQNSHVNNGDDCVSFKPNSTNILVQNMWCNGSHGISVGSLGQYIGNYDIVENIYAYNISMSNATDGARIKVWPGVPSALSGDLQGGGGSGAVKNITFDTFRNSNNDWAIELTQCYGQNNLTLCNQFPSSLTITDVLFTGFTGGTSKKYQPNVGTIVCSSPAVCNQIRVKDFHVTSPIGTSTFVCKNVDKSLLDVTCAP